MHNKLPVNSEGWLAFELNVLRRLKFETAALSSGGETKLGAHLKRWNARVQTNDLTQADWTKAFAEIENNESILAGDNMYIALEDAYIPRHRLQNPVLRNWFGESDAWWLDNVRQNVEKISSPQAKAVALKIGMAVGDYALSFSERTRELRQPLSKVFERICSIEPPPFNNNQKNSCANKPLNDFVAETYTDLMFLRLPPPYRLPLREAYGWTAWREEWIRGNADFWNEMETAQAGKLGSRVDSKTQYLQLVENILQTASHVPQWAIAYVEDGFAATQEIVETINRVRHVETIFTKDFSELTGTKAVIITA